MNALRIGFIGGQGVGKSSLASSFASFCEKRGRSAGVANFDCACRRILYRPSFDIRLFYSMRRLEKEGLHGELAAQEIYRRAMADSLFNAAYRKACSGREALLLDFAGSIDYFLLQGGNRVLAHFCDKIVFVTDYNAVRQDEHGLLVGALNSLAESAYGLPVTTFVNKFEVLEKKRRRLLQRSLFADASSQQVSKLPLGPSVVGGKVIRGSGFEGMGLKELFSGLEL